MRRIGTILLCAILSLSLQAQNNPLAQFTSTLKGHCAAFKYSYRMSGQMPLSGSGEIRFQGDSFTMKGDDLEIYCDGSTRWTVDTAAEECYIESVAPGDLDIEANPALIVGNLDKAFTFDKTTNVTMGGRTVTGVQLQPKNQKGNIRSVLLGLDAKKPVGARITLADGSTLEIDITGFTLLPQDSAAAFRCNTAKLGKNYILTDLR